MQTQINDIVESAIANLTKAAEVNSIVGKPILVLDGTTILPISHITFAFVAGGGEYGNKNLTKSYAKNNIDGNFAGGSGGGRKDSAQGGGKNVEALDDALNQVKESLRW